MLNQSVFKAKTAKSLIASMILAAGAATSASANTYAPVIVDPVSHDFRASHPFRVFVDIRDANNRGIHSGTHSAADAYVRNRMQKLLPGNILIVNNRRNADMLVRAQLTDYDLSFHITDVDRRNKKYKKRYRYTAGQCGLHKRAFYTRITEKGVARANYHVSFRLRGEGTHKNAFQINAAESYRYGEDLQALTNCGVLPSNNYPNSTVARLFSQAGGHYRDVLAQEIQTNGLRKLAFALARQVNDRSDQFYVALAARYADVPTHYERYSLNPRIYDFDDVEPRSRRQPAAWGVDEDW